MKPWLFVSLLGTIQIQLAIVKAAAFLSPCSNIRHSADYRRIPGRESRSKRHQHVDISETADRDLGPLEEWASACGVQRASGLQLTGETIDGVLDVALMTNENLPAKSPVLFIPQEMILSSNQAVQEFGRQEEAESILYKNGAETELPQYYLMLKILYEWERGDQSPWFPYLNSLPRWFCNGVGMTAFCYKCIPPLVGSLAQAERVRLNRLSVKKVPFLSVETRGNPDLWKWAFQIVSTRSFEADDGSGDLRIVPMADLVNHGTNASVEYTYDASGNCLVQTTRDTPAGSPLCMSYADPTNPSHLLAKYGFLDESSPATFCKIFVPHVNDELINLGYAYDRMLFYKESGDVSSEVWDVLLYQVLTEQGQLEQRNEFYQAHLCLQQSGDGNADQYEAIKERIHEQYYSETSSKLWEHLDTFLNELNDLSSKAFGRSFDKHPRLPLILRHNEFVKNTFLAVRQRHFG
ncbi:unnamed protein product [Cylindrotheca closterium]|uniref:SET domain-containing protein n=1 Tax=Cylindrotheca closterium TaxID=2856 RepID=A0AAD2FQ82_9STRA|nr:unnamed protein product [Cylindrotheca closterium]